ncbi:restriction endonuclease subunit S [Vibrio algicola]|uniref:Restriction endonuclease subunit S n=1 Tax=Vibrio algicola TaxID=2662262 RepID=A0A5Q0TC53_9VIBR|nr:restriction endonuclease subunit S [Vibrio algicola]
MSNEHSREHNVESLITEHIDIWTSTIKSKSASGRGSSKKIDLYGIKKLRELILELAVRGKLVPQDPSDEPAEVLLERIAIEKAQLVKDKKIKKPKALPEISEEEKPFELPNGWEWSRLGNTGFGSTGKTPNTKKVEYFKGNIPFIGPGQITLNGQILESEKFLSAEGLKNSTECVLGDILMVCIGGSIGKAAIAKQTMGFNQQINAIRALKIRSEYLYLAVSTITFYEELLDISTGSATPIINRGKWEELLVPIPPLQEQHRIVAKVDELMILCDQLESQTEKQLSAHQQLVETLLATLVASENAAELNQNWKRLAAYFDLLFTTEVSIDQLKQTILQLAVMGKLVPQNPNDEPASKLLERIKAEKEQLIKDKIYQKTSKLKPINTDIQYPSNWVSVQTGQVCPSIVPNRDRPKSFTGNIPWVTLPAFPTQGFYLDNTNVELALTALEVQQYSARLIPEKSVLMSCVGRFGLTAINTTSVTSNQQVHAFIVLNGLLPEYLSMVIKVEGKFLENVATSTTIAYLNKTNCESIQFGLPPTEEQHRIVSKADALMAICDQLKTKLSESQQTQLHLTDAIVEQAV